MALYYPPRTLNIQFKSLVLKADPDWQRAKTRETEYEFSNGRVFEANPDRRGPYAED